MTETEYFRNNIKNSLNSLIKDPSTWQPDGRYLDQARQAISQVNYDLEDGILLKF